MAEIDVVKKGSKTWLWIVIALLVVIALWFMMSRSPGSNTTGALEQDRHPSVALIAGAPQTYS